MRHHDRLSLADLAELIAIRNVPCVSLYLPCDDTGPQRQQIPLRMKNMLARAEAALKAQGQRWNTIEDLLRPFRDPLGPEKNGKLRPKTAALFSAEGFSASFELPTALPESVHVWDRFYIGPLCGLAAENAGYYALAVSDNHPRLYRGDRYALTPVDVPNMPKNIESALWADTHEKELQRHGAGALGGRSSGSHSFVHSTGPGTDMERRKADLKRYFDVLDAAVTPFIKHSPLPVILFGVAYELPILRQALSAPGVCQEEVHGNFDRRSVEEIRAEAWRVMQARFESDRSRLLELCGAMRAKKRTADALEPALMYARAGKVEDLLVDPGAWPNSDADEAIVRGMNEAASEVILHKGRVHSVRPAPGVFKGPISALLRY